MDGSPGSLGADFRAKSRFVSMLAQRLDKELRRLSRRRLGDYPHVSQRELAGSIAEKTAWLLVAPLPFRDTSVAAAHVKLTLPNWLRVVLHSLLPRCWGTILVDQQVTSAEIPGGGVCGRQ